MTPRGTSGSGGGPLTGGPAGLSASPAASLTAGLARITAQAVVPEQLLPYVGAVSGLRPRLFGECVGHLGEGEVVLVGYPPRDPRDARAVDAAVDEALALPGLTRITVLAAARPHAAPSDAPSGEDAFWSLPLPLPPAGQKLRNMLRRAARDIVIEQGGADSWTAEHAALVEDFCRARADALEPGSVHIFRHLAAYLAAAPQARLFSARRADGVLVGCAIGDYSSFSTAFYMFAFRRPDAPPGTADALLAALAAEGAERGHGLLNLGLGIHPGVAFFKKKWGASAFLPCVETSWTLQKKGWLTRLLGR
ncbi:GNAT family N-acetyltransferase [Desulfovibrio porci]|uniref:GNAT family N-acetyltransferase n=1 Tax=Desulfovibrio porci TaxID=2605782 RepID=UPI002A83851F|nr:GNAT family N-acetyltransferase [Desulfovibrio porci]MDY3810035.1 GNAT family N-acetyltransferase [Desulfovibrio porci]